MMGVVATLALDDAVQTRAQVRLIVAGTLIDLG